MRTKGQEIAHDAIHEGMTEHEMADAIDKAIIAAKLTPNPSEQIIDVRFKAEDEMMLSRIAATYDPALKTSIGGPFDQVAEVLALRAENELLRKLHNDASMSALRAASSFLDLPKHPSPGFKVLSELKGVMEENIKWHTENYGSSELCCMNIEALAKLDELMKGMG